MNRLQELERLMAHGHCAESRVDVHNTHGKTEALVRTYFYYIKQCIQKGFPSLEFMREYMGAEAARYGGYIDAQGEIQPTRDMAFVGSSDCKFTTHAYNIHRVWLQHDSRLEVAVTDNSHLHIDCFGNSRLVVRIASQQARVWINTYGNSTCKVEGFAECAKTTKYNQETY